MGSRMVITTYFPALRGYKFGLAKTYFSNPDCVCTDWFMQFSASQPFQCVIITIMNGCARLRFEFILQNRHHTPAFESPVVKIMVHGPYDSHQQWVFAEWFSQFTASQPLKSLFIGMINVRHGWDWYMGAEMVITTYFPALRGYKFGLAHTYFSNPDCVYTHWFRQFTASQPSIVSLYV